uniref:Uncharacterized protein n=1 Tax=Arundo donax TaxID=35708 RepID=A0A0A9GX08_ARUDO
MNREEQYGHSDS